MNQAIRWLLLLPVVALSVAATWLLYPLGRSIALSACPSSLRSTESTTDFSQVGYMTTSDTCLTGWFSTADGLLLVVTLLLSVFVAGFVGYRLPPSNKRLAAALSSVSVLGAVAVVFAYGF